MRQALSNIYVCELGIPHYSRKGSSLCCSVEFIGVKLCKKEEDNIVSLKGKYNYINGNNSLYEIEYYKSFTTDEAFFTREHLNLDYIKSNSDNEKSLPKYILRCRNLVDFLGKDRAYKIFNCLNIRAKNKESCYKQLLSKNNIETLESEMNKFIQKQKINDKHKADDNTKTL